MEEEIKTYLKHSLLSLIPRRHRARTTLPQHRPAPAVSITRIQAGMPHGHPVPAHARARPVRARRNARPATYTRGTYLSPSRNDTSPRRSIFRIA
jgi:hypothetical protein